jgi:threonine dehydratase
VNIFRCSDRVAGDIIPSMIPEPSPLAAVNEAVRPTTFVAASRLSKRLGVELTIASETFQHTGSFKFRAAYHVVSQVPQRHIITASSGNFGQGLAYACQLLRKSCLIVMPKTSAKIKIEAVREFGGEVELIDVTRVTRSARVAELAAFHGDAYVASPYDDPLVIAGNSTLGAELAGSGRSFDCVIAPVGGGGLTSGIIQGLRKSTSLVPVYGAEPALANDAARSLASGAIVINDSEPQTIADGARTVSLGKHNWAILREGLKEIVEVSEEQIKEAVRLLFTLANLKVEPTGALGVGALLAAPHLFYDKAVCCIASGGNVDPELFSNILSGQDRSGIR